MADYQEGHILTNNDTGDRVQLQDGKWVSIGPTVAYDVVHTTGPALARGTTGLLGSPGTFGELGAKGIDWATQKVGGALGVDPSKLERPDRDKTLSGFTLPTGGDLQNKLESYTGPMYQPQTTAGKFYNAAVEAVPGLPLGMGGGAVNTLKNVAKTATAALGGEAAGQATEGTKWEAPARMAGALAGGQVPSTGRRIYTPLPAAPAHLARAQNVESQGVRLGAGQYTGNPFFNAVETPMRNSKYGHSRGLSDPSQEEQISRALNRSTGGPDVLPTSPIVNAQRQNLASEQNLLAHDPTVQMPIDMPLRRDLSEVDRSHRLATGAPVFGRLGPNTEIDPLVSRVVGGGPYGPVTGTGAGLAGGPYSSAAGTRMGANWLNMRNDFSRRASGGTGAPEMQNAYGGLLRAIDEAMARRHPEFGRIAGQMENADALAQTVGAAGSQAAKGVADASTFYQKHRNQAGNPTATFARDTEAVRAPSSLKDPTQGHLSTILGGAAGLYTQHKYGIPDLGIYGLLMAPSVSAVAAHVGAPRAVMNPLAQQWLRNQQLLPSGETALSKVGRAARVNAGSIPFLESLENTE